MKALKMINSFLASECEFLRMLFDLMTIKSNK